LGQDGPGSEARSRTETKSSSRRLDWILRELPRQTKTRIARRKDWASAIHPTNDRGCEPSVHHAFETQRDRAQTLQPRDPPQKSARSRLDIAFQLPDRQTARRAAVSERHRAAQTTLRRHR